MSVAYSSGLAASCFTHTPGHIPQIGLAHHKEQLRQLFLQHVAVCAPVRHHQLRQDLALERMNEGVLHLDGHRLYADGQGQLLLLRQCCAATAPAQQRRLRCQLKEAFLMRINQRR